jgi:4'-phosphopantetheinyl transferase
MQTNNPLWRVNSDHLKGLPNEVQVWCARLDQPRERLNQLALILSADEVTRAGKNRTEAECWKFIAGRGMLRELLSKVTGRPAHRLEFDYSTCGKPELIQPLHAKRLWFNVSYADPLVIYALSFDQPVGVDLAAVQPVSQMEALVSRHFSADERQALMQLPLASRVLGFFNCWTRKEAYLKARGDAFTIPLRWFSVSLCPGEAPRLVRTPDQAEAKRWHFRHLEPAPGYVSALVVGAI